MGTCRKRRPEPIIGLTACTFNVFDAKIFNIILYCIMYIVYLKGFFAIVYMYKTLKNALHTKINEC